MLHLFVECMDGTGTTVDATCRDCLCVCGALDCRRAAACVDALCLWASLVKMGLIPYNANEEKRYPDLMRTVKEYPINNPEKCTAELLRPFCVAAAHAWGELEDLYYSECALSTEDRERGDEAESESEREVEVEVERVET